MTVLRRPHQHLVIEDHLAAFQAAPQLQDGDVAVRGGQARDGVFVRVGDAGGVPPGEGGGAAGLGGGEDGFADFQGE